MFYFFHTHDANLTLLVQNSFYLVIVVHIWVKKKNKQNQTQKTAARDGSLIEMEIWWTNGYVIVSLYSESLGDSWIPLLKFPFVLFSEVFLYLHLLLEQGQIVHNIQKMNYYEAQQYIHKRVKTVSLILKYTKDIMKSNIYNGKSDCVELCGKWVHFVV